VFSALNWLGNIFGKLKIHNPHFSATTVMDEIWAER